MGEVLPMPAVGDLFIDVRGDDRTMRVSHHQEHEVVVVSLWAGPVCRGSFRLAAGDVGRLAAFLTAISSPPAMPTAPDGTEPAAGAQPESLPPDVTGDVSRAALPPPRAPRVA